jgi:hypothetical protein
LPVNDMAIACLDLIDKYRLIESDGFGARIDPGDVHALAIAVQCIPKYAKIGFDEIAVDDGIALTEAQAKALLHYRSARASSSIEQMLTTRSSLVAYENYVTSDSELLDLLARSRQGKPDDRLKVFRKLMHIFLTVEQRVATRLVARLAATGAKDALATRFDTLEATWKPLLLGALTVER